MPSNEIPGSPELLKLEEQYRDLRTQYTHFEWQPRSPDEVQAQIEKFVDLSTEAAK